MTASFFVSIYVEKRVKEFWKICLDELKKTSRGFLKSSVKFLGIYFTSYFFEITAISATMLIYS